MRARDRDRDAEHGARWLAVILGLLIVASFEPDEPVRGASPSVPVPVDRCEGPEVSEPVECRRDHWSN